MQELFYDKNGRYAETQKELINDSGFKYDKPLFFNYLTGKELTDKDGKGIEGGDNDPNTWSVSAYFPRVKVGAWCKITSEGYWFTCNQDKCPVEEEY